MTPDPGGVSFEMYVTILAAGIEREGVDWHSVALAHGFVPDEWDAAQAEYDRRTTEDPLLAQQQLHLLHNAMAAIDGPASISLDAFIAINIDTMTGRPLVDVLAEHQLTRRQWGQCSFAWQDRLAQDAYLAAYADLREKKGIAERTHHAQREFGAVYGPSNLIRARRCTRCRALKSTAPATAYVYCDYCAMLFDYDASVVRNDPSALDPSLVDAILGRAAHADRLAAVQTNDRELFTRATRWMCEVGTEVSPGEYSPRVRDPAYRRALIDHLLVPTTVAKSFDPVFKERLIAVHRAEHTASQDWTLSNVLAHLAASKYLWEREYELHAELGIEALHPDGLDLEGVRYANLSLFVRPYLAILNDADQRALLAAAGITNEYVAAPLVAFSPCGCGNCGAKLQVAEGAQRVLCEQCGVILEVATRRFPCNGCGAQLSVAAVGEGVQCGYCGAQWARP